MVFVRASTAALNVCECSKDPQPCASLTAEIFFELPSGRFLFFSERLAASHGEMLAPDNVNDAPPCCSRKRRCVWACYLDDASGAGKNPESEAVQPHNRGYQVQAKTQA